MIWSWKKELQSGGKKKKLNSPHLGPLAKEKTGSLMEFCN